jgi:hypothetical protein
MALDRGFGTIVAGYPAIFEQSLDATRMPLPVKERVDLAGHSPEPYHRLEGRRPPSQFVAPDARAELDE